MSKTCKVNNNPKLTIVMCNPDQSTTETQTTMQQKQQYYWKCNICICEYDKNSQPISLL